ncbi:MAG: hypothetical protein JO053_02230 [Acidobacteria bacterium]|nr:hypothetical protein [Acidobacteriota bacterium]
MPTEIRQIDDPESRRIFLRVEGEMFAADAELLVRIAGEMYETTGKCVVIDLADLDLLDSEAASVLRPLAEREGISIEGVETFVQTSIDTAERHGI